MHRPTVAGAPPSIFFCSPLFTFFSFFSSFLTNCYATLFFVSASWGVDSLKMDGCNSIHTPEVLDQAYEFLGQELNATGRRMLYSCSWPDYIRSAPGTVNYTLTAEKCNIWRMYNDIQDSWDSVTGIVDWVGDNQVWHPPHGAREPRET